MNAGNVLLNIEYFIRVKHYLVSTPMINYVYHNAATKLAIDKLNQLEADYRKVSGDNDFYWRDYQFTLKLESFGK